MKKILLSFIFFFIFIPTQSKATIVVLVSTYDGFVIVADSRLILSSAKRDRIASDSYQKIVRVGRCSGLAFAGAALLYDKNNQMRKIGSLIEEYKIKNKIDHTTTISPLKIAEELKLFFEKIYTVQNKNIQQGNIQILVFGYDEEKNRRIFSLNFPSIKNRGTDSLKVSVIVDEELSSGTPASLVRGQTDVWHRIIKGYDPQLLNIQLPDTLRNNLGKLRYDIRYSLLSMQDAIDFAVFIVRATIEAQRFNQSTVMGVGGAIDVAIITTEGFKWIQKRKLYVEGRELEFQQ